jgi:hypothetical protein
VVQEGPYGIDIHGGNLINCERGLRVWLYPTGGNQWQSKTYKLELTFTKACSDLLASHQRKCDYAWLAWQHGGFLVTER